MKRTLCILLSLMLALTGLAGLAVPASAEGTGSSAIKTITDGELVAYNYASLTDAEKAVLTSGQVIGDSYTYSVPGSGVDLVSIDTDAKTITAANYADTVGGLTWVPTTGRVVWSDGSEEVTFNSGTASYNYEGGPFTAEVAYTATIDVRTNLQKALLNGPVYLAKGLDALAAFSGQIDVYDTVAVYFNVYSTLLPYIGDENAKKAITDLDIEIGTYGSVAILDFALEYEDAGDKVAYLFNKGPAFKDAAMSFFGKVQTIYDDPEVITAINNHLSGTQMNNAQRLNGYLGQFLADTMVAADGGWEIFETANHTFKVDADTELLGTLAAAISNRSLHDDAIVSDLAVPTEVIEIVVEQTAPSSLSTDISVLTNGVNTANAKTIWYGGSAWRVIGYGGEGVASEAGTATLLASENMDHAYFDDGSNGFTSKYDGSMLKARVDGIAAGFSTAERSAISKRTLKKGDFNYEDTDCITGDADLADQLLWPLSTKEAYALNETLRKADPEHSDLDSSYWWLRSPGINNNSAAIAKGDGSPNLYGSNVNSNHFGVRPAFGINLQSVLFTSAAEGGKQSAEDGTLSPVGDYTGSEWKLTVLDADRSDFTAAFDSASGDVRTVKYSGAKTGDNEYISAVIVDSDGAVTYYGRLCKAESGDNNTVTVDVSGKMNDGDKLYIFNEQTNGDKKTDYASALVDVTKASAEPVCRIEDAYYASIGEAVNAVTADDTVITILRDCEFDGLTEVAGHDIILESGETDVTVTLTGAMKFGKNNRSEIFTLRGNPAADTTLTIKPKLTDGTNAFRPIAVRSGNTLTVESGAVLEGSRFMTGNGGMVNVAKGATLNLNGGTIRDCSAFRGGAVYVDGGNCTIYEGRIENCTAEQGGAVYVSYNGKCFLYEGSIENCTAKHRTIAAAANSTVNAAGGAVYAVGLLQMENSTIKNCTAEYGKGGGVYLYPEQGTFWMQDSQISGCAATENADADLYYNDGRGGAVYVGKAKNTDAPDLCVVGSRITGNTAKEGGGVYLHEDGTMAAYREAYVSENTGGNVFVSDGAAIIAVMEYSQYALTGNALIGVTTQTEPTIGAPVRFGKTKADCKEYFISDSGNADVVYDADGKALLLQCTKKEETPAATFNATGYDTGTLDGLTAGMTYAVNGGTPVTVEGTSVTFTDIALPCVITVMQPGDGVTAYDSDPQTIELTRPDAPTLEVTPIEKVGDKGSIQTTTAHQKSTDGVNWTDCDGEWTNLDGGDYYVRTKPNGTALASDAQMVFFKYDPQLNVTVSAATQKEDTVITATFAVGTTGEVEFTLTGKENQYSFTAPIEFEKAQISQKLATDDYALTVSFAGSDIFLSDTVQTSFTVACAHEWNEPTWDWTDVDNPTYTATCKLCEDGTVSDSVQSVKGDRVEATVNKDAYTPYTATVTLDGHSFTGTFNLVEKGTALGAYKEQMKQAAEDKRLPGDSDACNRLIDDAIDAIDAVTYDETKTLDENKQAVDDAANFTQLDADLAEHRAIHYAEFYADGILTKRVPYTIDTESITEPAVPDKPGHTGAWLDYVLKADGVRIDAVYEVIMQTVDFDPNGGAGEMESVTTAWGSKITLPECGFKAPNGKEFDTWDAGNPGDEVEVRSDLTVKALWKEAPLTLTADVDPTQTGGCIAIKVPYAKRGAIAATLTASEEGVRYESSKPDVVSVDENGTIRLEKLCLFCRTATITAYSASGEKVASCVVNVRHAWWQYIIWFFLGSLWF